jgi:hypothetical protein
VHNAVEVVWRAKRVDRNSRGLLEIVFGPCDDIIPLDGDVIISIWTRVLMPETKSMKNCLSKR